jgi:hypothetical protein
MKDKLDKILSSKKFMIALSFLGLYLFSAGTSWAIFSYIKGPSNASQDISESRSKIDPDLPRTEECMINGKMYSEPVREIWESRRPLTAVVENHEFARPYSGRFLAVFHCGSAQEDFELAVIRSARVYFIDWAAEYGDYPLFLHWGGANNICSNCPGGVKPWGDTDPRVDSFKMLSKIGWRNGTYGNDLDGQSNFGYPSLVRVEDRLGRGEDTPDEHTPTAFIDLVFQKAEERGFGYKDAEGNAWDENYVSWKFTDGSALSTPTAQEISFEFWSNKGDYDVEWKYDGSTNSYLRNNGGEPFTDFYFDNEQIRASNVVVQFVKEEAGVDGEGHLFYKTTGTGDALVFQNGDVIEATWEKAKQASRTVYYDENDEEISFVRGEIWIEAVPAGNKVNY